MSMKQSIGKSLINFDMGNFCSYETKGIKL